MRFLRWLGGSLLVAGAVLTAYMTAAGAASGDAIYVLRSPGVVLSASQKTSAGVWARSVWPELTAAGLVSIKCDHLPAVTGTGAAATVDFDGNWECSACETYTASAEEKLDAELAGTRVTDGERCHTAKVADGSMSAAHALGLSSFARGLVGASVSEIVGSIFLARTPGQPARITAEVGMLVIAPPSTWATAKAKGDQPGGVVRTWGKIQ